MRLTNRLCKPALGFTLLEVMMALVIFSLVAVSLSMAVSQSTKNISILQYHQFAAWVAHNQLSLYQLDPQTSLTGTSLFAGNEFAWKMEVAATETAKFNKVTIEVTRTTQPEYVLANVMAFRGVD
jgi:general secretion pathway protein I